MWQWIIRKELSIVVNHIPPLSYVCCGRRCTEWQLSRFNFISWDLTQYYRKCLEGWEETDGHCGQKAKYHRHTEKCSAQGHRFKRQRITKGEEKPSQTLLSSSFCLHVFIITSLWVKVIVSLNQHCFLLKTTICDSVQLFQSHKRQHDKHKP